MAPEKNAVGGQVRKIRKEQQLSQAAFALLCRRNGWNITRETIAKIENRTRWVSDFELLLLAERFKVSVDALLPRALEWKRLRARFTMKKHR